MARRRVTVLVNGEPTTVAAPRPRLGGQLLMPTRTIASTRDRELRRRRKHRYRDHGE